MGENQSTFSNSSEEYEQQKFQQIKTLSHLTNVEVNNENIVVTGNDPSAIYIFDNNINLLQTLKKEQDNIHSLSLAINILYYSQGEYIKVYNIQTKKIIAELKSASGYINTMIQSPNHILCGNSTALISLFDNQSHKLLRYFLGHTNNINEIQMLSENLFISCSDDSTIKMWDIRQEKYLQNLVAHEGAIYSIGGSPDNNYFASGGTDQFQKIWDARKMKELTSFKPYQQSINKIRFYNDDIVISAGDQSKVILSNMLNQQLLFKYDEHKDSINSFYLHENQIYSVSNDRKLVIRSVPNYIITKYNSWSKSDRSAQHQQIFQEYKPLFEINNN